MGHLIRPEVIGVLNGKVGLVASSSMPSSGIGVAELPEPPDGIEVIGRLRKASIPSAEYVLASLPRSDLSKASSCCFRRAVTGPRAREAKDALVR
jgi:hypothetical protein